ncbi:hypothetical protein GGQ88_003775 [Novosphingobium hassiacum]|uniref:Uncharacterized protein n=1 Tax=Novosphingobium hassiacum TaxID=173676 RepID=A0A7W6EY40_9SPHN|nr:hypothetical protein [Novosphingobium hassiacum]MBB3862474.1 hypothetical protein [Novosphingobium hassiacum]
MESSLNAPENHYVGLGQLLAGAGVPVARTEQLISGMLAQSVQETRLTVSRDVCALVDGYIRGLDKRYATRLDDAQKLITNITIELEIVRRRARDERATRNRIVIVLIAMQFLASIAIIGSLYFKFPLKAEDIFSTSPDDSTVSGYELPGR